MPSLLIKYGSFPTSCNSLLFALTWSASVIIWFWMHHRFGHFPIQGWAKKWTPTLFLLLLCCCLPLLPQLARKILATWGPLFGPAPYTYFLPSPGCISHPSCKSCVCCVQFLLVSSSSARVTGWASTRGKAGKSHAEKMLSHLSAVRCSSAQSTYSERTKLVRIVEFLKKEVKITLSSVYSVSSSCWTQKKHNFWRKI